MIPVEGNNFVVTGGSGFIGSHICEELIKQKKNVVCVDNMSNPIRFNIFNMTKQGGHFVFLNRDVSKKFRIGITKKTDVVLHEACSKNTVCFEDPFKDLITNAYGSFKVFEAAQAVGAKVVHASTGSVYGDQSDFYFINTPMGPPELKESRTVFAPKSFYGVSKLAAEQYLRAFHEYYGLRFVALRYFHVYGPRQNSGPNGGVVAIFIKKILRGDPITIYGDGEQTRSFTYVKDVVRANFLAANSETMESSYFNVASGIRVTLNTLVELLETIIGKTATIIYKPARKGDIHDFYVDNTKIGNAGMREWTQFKDGLTETVEFYRAIA